MNTEPLTTVDTATDEPPGTVDLFTTHLNTDSQEINLQPQPTSDPNDPLNWSTRRKTINFTFTLAATAVIFTALSIQASFWGPMQRDIDVTYAQLNASSAVNSVGTAVGCLLFIPLAIKYGRRPVYLGSITVMFAMAIWTAKAQNKWDVYLTNLFFGMAGSTNETIVQMTVGDLYFVHQRARANGLYMVMVILGSFLTPVAAGYIADAAGWRLCYWLLTASYAILFVTFLLFYEETKFKVVALPGVEPQRSEGVEAPQIEDGMPQGKGADKPGFTQTAVDSASGALNDISINNANGGHIDRSIPMDSWKVRLRFITRTDEPLVPLYYRPMWILFTFPAVTYTGLQYSFCLCWIFVISNVIALVMPNAPYFFNSGEIGLMGLSTFMGCMIGSAYAGFLGDWTVLHLARKNHGRFEPEMRLHLQHIPAVVMSVGVLEFGLTIARGMHWIYPSIGGVLFGFGLAGISDVSMTYTIDCYRDITGEAFAGIAFLRNVFSIALIFPLTPWMKHQGIHNMFIVDAVWCYVVAALYIPFLIWGKRFRGRNAGRYRKFISTKGDVRT